MAYIANFVVEAGATFTRTITVTEDDGTLFDLTGYTATLQVRLTASSSSAAITKTPTINVPNATISWTFTAAETATLTASKYVYALELAHTNGTVIRLVQGDLNISPEVVR
jgi:hypothetical protein